jgi:hypothetical protein
MVWTPIPGSLTSIAVGSDGQVWGLNEDRIYNWNGTVWTPIPGSLARFPNWVFSTLAAARIEALKK